MGEVHIYRSRLGWSGSTAAGYEHYSRLHSLSCPPAEAELLVSSDPAFRGEAGRLNPEQLLLAAASSCQLLSFLAIIARARLDVLAYDDEAEAVMEAGGGGPMRITRITLRPRITVARGTDHDRVRRYVGVAHSECYIANSISGEVVIEATVESR